MADHSSRDPEHFDQDRAALELEAKIVAILDRIWDLAPRYSHTRNHHWNVGINKEFNSQELLKMIENETTRSSMCRKSGNQIKPIGN